jgi:hypothetical protein
MQRLPQQRRGITKARAIIQRDQIIKKIIREELLTSKVSIQNNLPTSLGNFQRKKGKVGLVSAELKPSHERGEHPMEGPQKGDATRRSCFCTFSTRVSRDELPTPEVRRDFLYEISAHKLRLFDSLIFSWEGVTPNEAGLRTGGKFAQFKRRYPDWGSAKERKLKQDRARTSRKVSRISLRA